MEIFLNRKHLITIPNLTTSDLIKNELFERFKLHHSEYYLLANGRLLLEGDKFEHCTIHLVPRVNGGKGGFGSMLRAIGAQIEKTTNREACRDLSGRRLRDINEEQRLKNWIAAQAEREKEAAERKQKKLERLCQLPKHEFKDEQYDKERSELPEKVVDAVEQGLKVAGSSVALKRKKETTVIKKKKAKLWVDAEVEDELSSTDDESDNENSDEDSKSSQEKGDEKVLLSSSAQENSQENEDQNNKNEKEIKEDTSKEVINSGNTNQTVQNEAVKG